MVLFKEFFSNFIRADPYGPLRGLYMPGMPCTVLTYHVMLPGASTDGSVQHFPHAASGSRLVFAESGAGFALFTPGAEMGCATTRHGISCTEQGRVIGISLPANHLSGTIPPDIGNLTSVPSPLSRPPVPWSAARRRVCVLLSLTLAVCWCCFF